MKEITNLMLQLLYREKKRLTTRYTTSSNEQNFREEFAQSVFSGQNPYEIHFPNPISLFIPNFGF